MKKLTLMIAAVLCFAVLSIAQADYTMYKTVYIKPSYDKLEDFGKSMAEHNKTYHSEGSMAGHIWMVQTGPHTGDLLYVQGSTTFTELDNMDMGADHKEHWLFEVMPNIKEISDGEYWKMDSELSYDPETIEFTGKEVLAIFELVDFEEYRFKAILEDVKEVYEQKGYGSFFQVYFTQFDSYNGRDVLIASSFENWAFFDNRPNFRKDFIEIHGEGSWSKLMEEFRDCVASSYDEVIMYVPELSGPAE